MENAIVVQEFKVDKSSLFKEIALNIKNPKEILREAISNSVDAGADAITITLGYDVALRQFVITIKDNGKGIKYKEYDDFFSLGGSIKEGNYIGNKGLGTKTFLKCNRLEVISQTNDRRYKAIVDKPWEKLQKGEVLKYSIVEEAVISNDEGTLIRIMGYKVDHPSTKYFKFDDVVDYIKWKTAGGSFKSKFVDSKEVRNLAKNMMVIPVIQVIDEINCQSTQFIGNHPFGSANLYPIGKELKGHKRSYDYNEHFGPFNVSTILSGKLVSYQIYATVSGYRSRSSIAKFSVGESHKTRFGVILCKDFQYIENIKEILLGDGNYNHFHIMLNSQNFMLTSDRNNISNIESEEVQWIFESAKKLIREKIYKVAHNSYFKLIEEEESEFLQQKKLEELKKRIQRYEKLDYLKVDDIDTLKEPRTEAQVIVILITLLAKGYLKEYKLGEYSSISTTDLILEDSDGLPILTEVEFKLSSLFRHKHLISTFDLVICWKNDLKINDHMLTLGNKSIGLFSNSKGLYLKYDANKTIKIIELEKIINGICRKT